MIARVWCSRVDYANAAFETVVELAFSAPSCEHLRFDHYVFTTFGISASAMLLHHRTFGNAACVKLGNIPSFVAIFSASSAVFATCPAGTPTPYYERGGISMLSLSNQTRKKARTYLLQQIHRQMFMYRQLPSLLLRKRCACSPCWRSPDCRGSCPSAREVEHACGWKAIRSFMYRVFWSCGWSSRAIAEMLTITCKMTLPRLCI